MKFLVQPKERKKSNFCSVFGGTSSCRGDCEVKGLVCDEEKVLVR